MENFVYKGIRFPFFVMKTLLGGAELALRKLQDHLLFLAVVSSRVHRKRQNNEIISFSPL